MIGYVPLGRGPCGHAQPFYLALWPIEAGGITCWCGRFIPLLLEEPRPAPGPAATDLGEPPRPLPTAGP